jgi:hypothetical protein
MTCGSAVLGLTGARLSETALVTMFRVIGTSWQLPPTSYYGDSDDTRRCKSEKPLNGDNGPYCDSPPATVRASTHLPYQMGPVALDGREGPGSAATGTALRTHIASIPCGEDGVGCEGG